MPFKDPGTAVLKDKKQSGDNYMITPSVAVVNNNVSEEKDEDEKAETRRLEEANHIVPGTKHNFTNDEVQINGGVLGGGDGFTGRALVLEALKKSTNTAQL